MSSRSTIHRLLFNALLELRNRGRESDDTVVFHLADLFHNVALQLEKADSVESYDAILSYLRNRAAEKGCEAWLERQLARLEEAPAAR